MVMTSVKSTSISALYYYHLFLGEGDTSLFESPGNGRIRQLLKRGNSSPRAISVILMSPRNPGFRSELKTSSRLCTIALLTLASSRNWAIICAMRTLNQSNDSRGWEDGLYAVLDNIDDVVNGGGARRTDDRFFRSCRQSVGDGTLDVCRGSLTSASPKMKNFRNAQRMRITES